MSQLIGNMICILATAIIARHHGCYGFQCYSCFAGCPTLSQCECRNQTCDGAFCFSKIERFPADGVSAILKGCADDVPTDLLGCQHAGDRESVECYCSGNLCNVAERMQHYKPKDLPMIQCCKCDPDERPTVSCRSSTSSCAKTCNGHYCYTDLTNNARDCGYGYPQLYNNLRTNHLSPFLAKQTCVNTTTGDPRISPWTRSCACVSGYCNRRSSSWSDDEDQAIVAAASPKTLLNCHSFSDSSQTPFTIDAYRKSTNCSGHFCFLTLYTHQIIMESDAYNNNQEGNYNEEDDEEADDNGDNSDYRRNRRTENQRNEQLSDGSSLANVKIATPSYSRNYDFNVGCMSVDDRRKVRTGCTTEYGGNGSHVITRVCVCDADYCNFYNLLTGEPAATLVPRRRPLIPTTTATPSVVVGVGGQQRTTRINTPIVVATLVLPVVAGNETVVAKANANGQHSAMNQSVSERIAFNNHPTQKAARNSFAFPMLMTFAAILNCFLSRIL